jgi:MFS family permease
VASGYILTYWGFLLLGGRLGDLLGRRCMLLTNTFRDPDILARQARRLSRWIDGL